MRHSKTLLLFLALSFIFVIVGIAQEKAEETVTCPVSGKVMKKSEAKVSYEFEGKTFYFCCEDAKEKFIKSPEEYLKKKAEMMHKEQTHGEETHMHKKGEEKEHAHMHEKGEEEHSCAMKDFMDSKDVEIAIKKLEDGIAVTITSKNPDFVKKIHEMAVKMKSEHEHKEEHKKKEIKKEGR
jgi:YHS domain-containing protein